VRVLGVPGLKCDTCRELVFDHDVSVKVQKLVRSGADGAERLEPLYVKTWGGDS
jgi:hypothetical protein